MTTIITCEREVLADALARVSRGVASSRTSIPILQHVLLSTNGAGLDLAGTDLDIRIEAHVNGPVEGAGAITVPAKMLAQWVKQTIGNPVELTFEDGSLGLKCDHRSLSLRGGDAEGFPVVPDAEPGEPVTVNGEAFAMAVSRAAVAVATDMSRPVLTGIFLQVESGTIRMTGANGYVLCHTETEAETNAEFSAIVPAKAMTEAARLVDDEVSIRMLNHLVMLDTDDTRVLCNPLEGTFPDYHRILPAEIQTEVVVNTDALINAVKTCYIVAREAINFVKLDITQSKMVVSSKASDVGTSTSEVAVSTTGDDMQIGFNARLLLGCLGQANTDEVVLGLQKPTQVASIKPTGDESCTFVLAPMHLEHNR